MNWYKRAQFVGFSGLVNSIYQRLIQADNDGPDAESAVDDLATQGASPQIIEEAIQRATQMIVGPEGHEGMLGEGQRYLLMTLRGQPTAPPTTQVEYPMSQPLEQPAEII